MSAPRLPFDEEPTALRLGRSNAARLDKLEISDKEAHRQIGKLTKGLTVVLNGQNGSGEESEGQPDWLMCRDPDEAIGILTDTGKWLEECGYYYGFRFMACWPWHPPAVALLLAAARHYQAAYSGQPTVTVIDLLTRYLPAIQTAVHTVVRQRGQNQCSDDFHVVSDVQFLYDETRVNDMAIWWATGREGLAPGLSPRSTS